MTRSVYPDPEFVPHYPWLGNLENNRRYEGASVHNEREASDEPNSPLRSPQNLSSNEDYESLRAVSS